MSQSSSRCAYLWTKRSQSWPSLSSPTQRYASAAKYVHPTDRNSLFSSFPLVVDVFNLAASGAQPIASALLSRARRAFSQLAKLVLSLFISRWEKKHHESSGLFLRLCWCGRIATEQKPPHAHPRKRKMWLNGATSGEYKHVHTELSLWGIKFSLYIYIYEKRVGDEISDVSNALHLPFGIIMIPLCVWGTWGCSVFALNLTAAH